MEAGEPKHTRFDAEGVSSCCSRVLGDVSNRLLATVNFREAPKGEVRRIPLPRTPVNRSKKEGQRLLCSEGQHVYPKRCFAQGKAPLERGLRGELVPP